ncbi:hypothetical protein Anapl_04625 [Anas platyrhynchos]|uniref:Uncharacterized protein n=1 Tax=Anas platyrhynchos TaxID=8839 RepID=R0LEI0_ANAPL|nr:hypothetical protein Anapl_04625 [Anas platyrhynchos]
MAEQIRPKLCLVWWLVSGGKQHEHQKSSYQRSCHFAASCPIVKTLTVVEGSVRITVPIHESEDLQHPPGTVTASQPTLQAFPLNPGFTQTFTLENLHTEGFTSVTQKCKCQAMGKNVKRRSVPASAALYRLSSESVKEWEVEAGSKVSTGTSQPARSEAAGGWLWGWGQAPLQCSADIRMPPNISHNPTASSFFSLKMLAKRHVSMSSHTFKMPVKPHMLHCPKLMYLSYGHMHEEKTKNVVRRKEWAAGRPDSWLLPNEHAAPGAAAAFQREKALAALCSALTFSSSATQPALCAYYRSLALTLTFRRALEKEVSIGEPFVYNYNYGFIRISVWGEENRHEHGDVHTTGLVYMEAVWGFFRQQACRHRWLGAGLTSSARRTAAAASRVRHA